MLNLMAHRTVFRPDGDSGGNDAGNPKSGKGDDLGAKPATPESGGPDVKVPTDPKTGELEAQLPAN